MNAQPAPLEGVRFDPVRVTVFDGNAVVAVPHRVADDRGVVAVAAPDSVVTLVENVLEKDVAVREGRLDAIGRGMRKIVLVEKVSVAAARAGLLESFIPRIEEEAVATVRRGVVSEDVVARLLVDEDPCRVLPAVIDLVAEASHAPVELVVRDFVS